MPGPIEVSQAVAAPAPVVWSLITDIEHSPEVISGIRSVERLDDGDGFGVGTRWRETRVMFGRSASEEMTITAVDPGWSYTAEAGSSRFSGVWPVHGVGHAARVRAMWVRIRRS